jgi:hypothetical protein
MKKFVHCRVGEHRRTLLIVATALNLLLPTFRLLAVDQAPATLKEAFKGSFLIGAALNPAQFTESDARDAAIVKAQFDSISLDVDVLPPAMQYRGADISANVALQPKLNPYTNGMPDSLQQTLAKRYADLFGVFLKHRADLTRVTFWGVTDARSWLNNWPVRGRTSYPLLFDREGRPKQAFNAVIKAASGASAVK